MNDMVADCDGLIRQPVFARTLRTSPRVDGIGAACTGMSPSISTDHSYLTFG
jgi:hypothetical protein